MTLHGLRTRSLLLLVLALTGCGESKESMQPFPIDPPIKNREITGPAVQADDPPPPISGGTLLVAQDGKTIVAADPDRDAVWFMDAKARKPAPVALRHNDEPGRVVEGDDAFFVALRRGGAIARIDGATKQVTDRFVACAAPRGLAYVGATDTLKVACAGGDFVKLNAKTGAILSKVNLGPDLRDVVVDGTRTLVSRFRTAEILVLDDSDAVVSTLRPFLDERHQSSLAWRMRPDPAGGVLVSHQFAQLSEVDANVQGGYGGFSCDSAIVTAAVTHIVDGAIENTTRVATTPLPVDVTARQGQTILVSAGALHESNAVSSTGLEAFDPNNLNSFADGGVIIDDIAEPDGDSDLPSPQDAGAPQPSSPPPPRFMDDGGTRFQPCTFAFPPDQETQDGRQTVAVDVLPNGTLVSQSRDPWMITIGTDDVKLPGASRKDSGHDLFHEDSGAGIACASCHGEGGDDGVAWRFRGLGKRRTPDLRGGILGTAPFHWDGEFSDMASLMDDVFVGRMNGPSVPTEHMNALSHWVDTMPAGPHVAGLDMDQVARGKALFESNETQCASCHSGKELTNNQTVGVGTGQNLQVPRLAGLGMRAPYMHNGCASTLEARLTDPSCGGGDAHGKVSQLADSDRADLVAYLTSL